MPLKPPVIDNRTFDDIVDEARTRIPRYTPEWTWTDLNDNDPGIALLQVFAWMTEMLIFRMAQVPRLNYVKFLQLIGIELKPAVPARAEVTFPVTNNNPNPYVDVPLRAQVAAESDEGDLVIFETERALVALTARLAAVQTFGGANNFTSWTQANEDVENPFFPLGEAVNHGNALLLGFDYDDDFPPDIELNLSFFMPEEAIIAEGVVCGRSAPRTSIRLVWEYWAGTEWRAMTLLNDETRALTRSGHVYLRTPPRRTMQRRVFGQEAASLYWIQARFESGAYERAPRVLAIRTNTVEVIQAETIENEVLGGTSGEINQTFQLENFPVLQDTLVLEIDEGLSENGDDEGGQTWKAVEDFLDSGPEDRHYVLNRTTGKIRFGDGKKGRIPLPNVNNPSANVVAVEYRVGGGRAGNVVAGSLTTLVTSIQGIDENNVTNLRPAFGGGEEETQKEAEERARLLLKGRDRAVTPEDFEALARQIASVKRAKALPLHHPKFPGVQVPGVVTVIVVPDSDSDNPTPNEDTLSAVCECLNQRRLLTTEVHVVRPTYRRVEVQGVVIAENDADLATVRVALNDALLTYFHPLTGGEDGQGWPFGGDIFFSRVYQRVFAVSGVRRIERLVFLVEGEEMPECKDIEIPEGVLLYSTEHNVEVNYAFDS